MKKLFTIAVLAAALFAAPASAQVKFGLKGGLNVNKMKVSGELSDSKNQAGFYIGPTVKFTLPVVGLGIDAAALFDQRTAKLSNEVEYMVGSDSRNSETVEEKIKMQSIQIPINVRYSVGLGDMASIFFFAGPQFGFNVGKSKKELEEVEWKTNASNLSLNFGLGATVINHLEVFANYNLGLGKTGEFKEQSTFDQARDVYKARNNTWQVGVAYYF